MIKHRWFGLGLALVLAMGIITGCGSAEVSENRDGKMKVTTTIGMIADIVQNVGGEHVEVTGLMGPGVDPHLYKASQGDIAKLEQADAIFYNGLFLEGKMGDI
jgi:manganese/zinc/iron transport system substrate-binding protein